MKALFFSLLVTLSACQSYTSFYGPAKVKGGAGGCKAKCGDLEFVGMVHFGEYSDGCVCRVKGQNLSLLEIGSQGGGALASYWTQETERRAQAAAAHSSQSPVNPHTSGFSPWGPGSPPPWSYSSPTFRPYGR